MKGPQAYLPTTLSDFLNLLPPGIAKLPGNVIIRDPEYFVAGELHYHYKTRERILHVFHKRD